MKRNRVEESIIERLNVKIAQHREFVESTEVFSQEEIDSHNRVISAFRQSIETVRDAFREERQRK